MTKKYSIVISCYFKRLWRFAITLLLSLCALTYSVVCWIPMLIPLIFVAISVWIWSCTYDFRLILFFLKVKRELHSNDIQTKTITVQKIKSDIRYNVEGISVRAEGTERYILYGTDKMQYRLCAKEEMAALDDLNALNGATLKITYLSESGFLLSLYLLKKAQENPEEQQKQNNFAKELKTSFEQYLSSHCGNKVGNLNNCTGCHDKNNPKLQHSLHYNLRAYKIHGKYSKITNCYFKRVWTVLIFTMLLFCKIIYDIIQSNPLWICGLFIFPVCISLCPCDIALIVFFHKVRTELSHQSSCVKTIKVKKIKSNRTHNFYASPSEIVLGIEHYILYDTFGRPYYFCSNTAKVNLVNLCALNNAIIRIEFLPESKFLLSLQLLKTKSKNLQEFETQKTYEKEIARSFKQYISPIC